MFNNKIKNSLERTREIVDNLDTDLEKLRHHVYGRFPSDDSLKQRIQKLETNVQLIMQYLEVNIEDRTPKILVKNK